MFEEAENTSSSASADPRRRTLRQRLAAIADRPDDPQELRLRKHLQVTMAVASVPAVGCWGAAFFAIGRPDAGVQPLYYCAGTVAMLLWVWATKNYRLFSSAHTLLVMLGPYALHVWLGGFAASGGALLWSAIAPIAALMFSGIRLAIAWVALLGALILLNGAREVFMPGGAPLTPAQSSAFFTFNALGLIGFVFFSLRHFTTRIQVEQARADRLLLNILPAPIATRLKRSPGVIAERFAAVTVLFSDLVGFTQLSARLDAAELVALLDAVFTRFDALADQHGLEKIKTIGDAYMVVAGLPVPCADHAARAAKMALGMRAAIDAFCAERSVELKMRIGLHTGEVVAGVIGTRKFSYDLWGDTVNVASRMESHGEPGKIQISQATHAALGDGFVCTPRGTIAVKGKGEISTWWLER